ncbi:MAG: hypothetical protein FD174_2787 [Geobacteraceae bacterium]|nr:MAG: hypothetical protein FD174_2787 [Geobacteraceae bacterium]
MRVEDYPNLMILKTLTAPIVTSEKRLQEIATHIADSKIEVVGHGLFVLAVSSVEVMISDVLNYFLRSFPQKLPSNEFKFDKDTFFENYFLLLNKAVDSHINGLSYKSFEDFFRKCLEYLAIDWPDFFKTFGNQIKEIKATRNLLLHNNLVVNDQYLDSAGPSKRESTSGRHLSVNMDYLKRSLDVLLRFEDQFKGRLNDKYRDYSKINANKTLWNFLFTK